MTLPVLTSSAINFSASAVASATFTRPTATGGTAAGDLLIAVLNTESTAVSSSGTFQANFPLGYVAQIYADGIQYVGARRATGSDPVSWSVTMAPSSAHQAIVLAYRNVAWLQDRVYTIKSSSVTVSGVTDLDAHGPNFDVLPIHILCMDCEAAARTLTPGAGLTSVFNSEEATTFLRTTVLHEAEKDSDAIPLPAINSTLSVAEGHAIVAFTLAGVALPSGIIVADGLDLPCTLTEAELAIAGGSDRVGDPPMGGAGASVPTTGQLWPRGV